MSKQVVGSVLVHVANLGMSMFSSGTLPMPGDGSEGDSNAHSYLPAYLSSEDPEYRPNPCSFYLLNLLIDVSSPSSSSVYLKKNSVFFGLPYGQAFLFNGPLIYLCAHF